MVIFSKRKGPAPWGADPLCCRGSAAAVVTAAVGGAAAVIAAAAAAPAVTAAAEQDDDQDNDPAAVVTAKAIGVAHSIHTSYEMRGWGSLSSSYAAGGSACQKMRREFTREKA